ncbi:exodeoxyribonuclease V subunit gamma [Tessaracoccus sp. HDW20]|nr:exodeoxyribonuclease V subunit gamma [Tessaracoccus coleopterorum]
MALALVTAHRWATLLDHLAARLRESSDDPFAWSRVVVSSAATGRIVGQEMAARLGISAGVEYVTPGQLMGRFAERAGVARDRSRWLGTPSTWPCGRPSTSCRRSIRSWLGRPTRRGRAAAGPRRPVWPGCCAGMSTWRPSSSRPGSREATRAGRQGAARAVGVAARVAAQRCALARDRPHRHARLDRRGGRHRPGAHHSVRRR